VLKAICCSSAILSADGKYRYRLSRQWNNFLPSIIWLMLNPSTADAYTDDHTISKCIGFAKEWGFGGIEVINLWAFRSTDPKNLLIESEPFGPYNWNHIDGCCSQYDDLVVAWGCEHVIKKMSKIGQKATDIVEQIAIKHLHLRISCLGKSPGGNPYHPLMLPYSTPRIQYGALDWLDRL
jgi:hypothetical protein